MEKQVLLEDVDTLFAIYYAWKNAINRLEFSWSNKVHFRRHMKLIPGCFLTHRFTSAKSEIAKKLEWFYPLIIFLFMFEIIPKFSIVNETFCL